MSMCLVAMVVLGVMSIFSAKYRKWAREAFDCVLRRLTLRACTTSFNEKVRAKITSGLMKRHMGLARFTHRHFEAISWAFTIIMFLSLAYTAYTAYNLVVLGTCDPANPENCVFNPGGNPNRVVCPYEDLHPRESVQIFNGFRDITSATITGKPIAYFFGTTWCPHCAWERPIFEEVTSFFGDDIEVVQVEIDVEQPEEEMAVFNHYSENGYIPLIVIGGKYFRIGAGEDYGEQAEKDALTALLCRASGSEIPECSQDAVASLISRL